jgi:phosphoglycerate kinase
VQFVYLRPCGVFEFPAFAAGSEDLLNATIEAAHKGATVIVGGGDTATVVAQYGAEDKLSHVSTGGGASLELLEGKVGSKRSRHVCALH